ncbi:HD-GYP domain-containing protein [Vibrio sonorensis]|uniref:HD-GYP domain-containing protein n=1 Tax=Vibrio sonorensis TaxID=1004316 RepID=UPI0008DA3979|nr:HD-GYP domain-containing protein [Vibrio sonorensis]
MQYDPNDSIKIPIDTLSIGMFVTAIQHNERVNLANAGRVSSDKAIEQLKKNGIRFAWVDKGLSKDGCIFKPVEEAPSNPEPVASESQPSSRAKSSTSRYDMQKRANKIIKEAKGLAHKIIHQTFEGNEIHVEDIEHWADDLIEAALINSDAIQCVSALRKKDAYLLEHSVNVACLLVTFGKHLGMPRNVLKQLAIGGIIHDVGKVKVDDRILHKPAKLTEKEFAHMKLHQVYAKDIITNVKGLSPVSRDVCLMHHEKLDGNGYPLGLKEEQIPLHGRMSGIVDVYDALTADRCYKRGMSPAEAFKVLLGLTPAHLDRQLVYKFINCIGVYPVGSIVELSDGKVAIVWSINESNPVKPQVKCFYSRKHKHFVDVSYVDLRFGRVKIERAIAPCQLEVDATPFYET